MKTVTLLQQRKDRLHAAGIPSWSRPSLDEALQLQRAPNTTKWLFLLPTEAIQDYAQMTLFAAILRALGESVESVAWGEMNAPIAAGMLAQRFPALKNLVCLGQQIGCYFTADISQFPTVIPVWQNQFRVIISAGLSQLLAQPEAKRWLWQQLQAV